MIGRRQYDNRVFCSGMCGSIGMVNWHWRHEKNISGGNNISESGGG